MEGLNILILYSWLNKCENAKNYAITSDDIFSLKSQPKYPLIVGGGYVALETAGFLANLGSKVTVASRSYYLKSK